MSVVFFIGGGLMVLFGLFMLLMPTSGPLRGTGFGPILGIIYILLAAIYIMPAFFLHQYASAIGHLMQDGGDVAMEAALGSQKAFWRLVGIMTLVILCLYVVIIAVAMFGVVAAMTH
jgi:hypothetical protein